LDQREEAAMTALPHAKRPGRRPYVAPEVKVLKRSEAVGKLKRAAEGGSREAEEVLRALERRMFNRVK
jgi:hypothetical protein